MPSHPQQVQLDRIQEKKTLYVKRVEDAREKNRPDIEKIWLDEIKVLDEEYNILMAQQSQPAAATEASSSSATSSPPPNTEHVKRELRQLENQIQYIERKIGIHKERNEWVAVRKQTTLLEELKSRKKQLSTQTSTRLSPPAPTSPPQLTTQQQKQLEDIDRQIAQANKMIAEYEKYRSPKAQQWIGKKYQLQAQRNQLLGSSPATTSTATPPPLPTQPSQPQAGRPSPVPADVVTTAIETNKQIRVIDLEIAHADKMIKEYQRYNSPKATQWIQRKNELLARRSRITGQGYIPQGTASSQDPDVKKRLSIITLELAHAEKMIREYQKYNSPKANEWIDKKQDLLAERQQLEGTKPVAESDNTSPTTATPATSREAIKAQISQLNRQAKEADTQMRNALKRGDHQQANRLLQQRNQYNDQVKQLTAQLSGAGSTTPAPATPVSPSTPSRPTPAQPDPAPAGTSQQTAPGKASELEKSIAYQYLNTRNYTDEHAYKDIINQLLKKSRYQNLIPARETLYDITHPSKLPPAGTRIATPFIRDCFKIKISDIRLEDYTIIDTIFDTSFPEDFDRMVDRINPHLAPAPALKYYQYLAHRDAIQLIPSDRSISKYNSQFAGAKLQNLMIKNITIRSRGSLQGLFASDGAFENIHMKNIKVETGSAHQIAILGLLSGTLDLSTRTGSPMKVTLLPLRLAGGNNIYINSFSRNSSYQYGKVSAGQSNAVIADNRQSMTKRGTYYKDFNMDDFFAALRRADSKIPLLERIKVAAKASGTLARVI